MRAGIYLRVSVNVQRWRGRDDDHVTAGDYLRSGKLAYVLSVKRAHQCSRRDQPQAGLAIAVAAMAGYLALADVFDGSTQRGDEFGQWRVRRVGAARDV
ncbi:MAG: hypothetical protein DRR11_11705 [Gammaproteobacteria bacterium]|nr:MAG: hypothetical protein DRR11_11705 [Gammaproteobacteria bacterium]RLA36779.1 MAG: hypothetical protein DRR15_03910 [Gammaproteobacteria bacterium]